MVFQDAFARMSLYGRLRNYILQHTEPDASGHSTYFLYEPCKPEETEMVSPWWAPEEPIRVCKDTHQPARWNLPGSAKGKKLETGCNTYVVDSLEPAKYCGCGPNLMRCSRDRSHFDEINDSLREEIAASTAYVVANDLPIETLFTAKETFRDRNAEFVYRHWKAEEKKTAPDLVGLQSWPAEGRWAAREESLPGMHAGVLTAPHLIFQNGDHRQRQRVFYRVLWCSEAGSFGATAEDVFGLGSGNLQVTNEGWKVLAAKPVCTNCHARLDYGMQFFAGFENSQYVADHFVPASQHAGTGELYGDNIEDPRGEAPLNPSGFAKLVPVTAKAKPPSKPAVTKPMAKAAFAKLGAAPKPVSSPAKPVVLDICR